jgi:hypothetical protein
MANARTGNIIFVDTTGYSLDQTVCIKSVKYIGNTSGTAVISAGTSGSGQTIWKESGATNQAVDEIEAHVDGFYVTLTNSAQVLIYLE